MEHQPPPFFKRGPSLTARLSIFVVISLAMMVTDAHFKYLGVLRQSVSVLIYPMQKLANSPMEILDRVNGFFVSQSLLERDNRALKQQQLIHSSQLLQLQALQSENAQLRKLFTLQQRYAGTAVVADILYGSHDPFVRKIVVDKGFSQHIQAGDAVLDDMGVIGQVTRAYPFSSEITLLTDKNQAVPVQILRTGQRAVVVGLGQESLLDLPFMPANGDIQNGDVLITSGIDGTYPAGLPVATVTKIERNTAHSFAKITCSPSAGADRHKQVLILSGSTLHKLPEGSPLDQVQPSTAPTGKKRK